MARVVANMASPQIAPYIVRRCEIDDLGQKKNGQTTDGIPTIYAATHCQRITKWQFFEIDDVAMTCGLWPLT